MQKRKEYASAVDCVPQGMNFRDEIRKAITEIQDIRKKPLICYMANVVSSKIKSSTGIDSMDDLPFSEMVDNIDTNIKDIDIVLVTPGGSAEQVAKFVNKLRPRFDYVTFILPNISMSAGTIFALSGDEIFMDSRAYIGPIDPQVPNRDGRFVPAQSLLTVLSEIQERGQELLKNGQNPLWTDVQILNNIDAKEIGNAINASRFSIEMVTEYLSKYKFRTWVTHKNGTSVTPDQKLQRATEIASQLCDHAIWKTHSRGITREIALSTCRLKISHPEDVAGLNDGIRRFWALVYWIFESLNIRKIFISDNYSIFRTDVAA